MDPTPLVVRILAEALAVPVSTEMPFDRQDGLRPDRLVTVDLMGGTRTPYLLMPRYMLTCWGRSDADAHGMAIACVEALWAASETDDLLSSCQLESLGRDEWSRTGQARYVAVVDLTINTDE